MSRQILRKRKEVLARNKEHNIRQRSTWNNDALPELDTTTSSKNFNSMVSHHEKEAADHKLNCSSSLLDKDEKKLTSYCFCNKKLNGTIIVFMWRIFLPLLTWTLLFSMWKMHSVENWRFVPFLLYIAPLALSSQATGRDIFLARTSSVMSYLAKELRLRVIFLVPNAFDQEYAPLQKSTKEGGSRSGATNEEKEKDVFIIGMHPHGKYPANIIPWIEELKHASSKTEKFAPLENMKLAQSSLGKFIPTIAYPTSISGVIDVTRKSICATLARNESVALFPGGAREMTLCQPYTKQIKLMKRSGFLRLAWNQVHNAEKDLEVLPVFLFGMNDAYFNPLDTLDQLLFNMIGINIPLWLPTTLTDFQSDNVMVIGRALNPKDYKNTSALVSAYYTELQSIFDSNKHKYPAYKDRSIEMVEEMVKHSKKKPSLQPIYCFMGVLFIAVALYHSHVKESLFLLSVWKTAEESLYSNETTNVLSKHIIFASIWTVGSGIQFSMKFTKNIFHRVLGLISVTSAICVHVTAVAVCLLRSSDDVFANFIWSWKDFLMALHVIGVQLLANMAVSLSTTTLLSDSMKAMQNSDYRKHSNLLRTYNTVLFTNLLPRVISKVFRYEFPFLTNEVNYTLAVVVVGYIQFLFIREKPHLVSRVKKTSLVSLFALLVYPSLVKVLFLQPNCCVYIVSIALVIISFCF